MELSVLGNVVEAIEHYHCYGGKDRAMVTPVEIPSRERPAISLGEQLAAGSSRIQPIGSR